MKVDITKAKKATLVFDQLTPGEVYLVVAEGGSWIPLMMTNDGYLYNLRTGAKLKNALERDYYECEASMSVVIK